MSRQQARRTGSSPRLWDNPPGDDVRKGDYVLPQPERYVQRDVTDLYEYTRTRDNGGWRRSSLETLVLYLSALAKPGPLDRALPSFLSHSFLYQSRPFFIPPIW